MSSRLHPKPKIVSYCVDDSIVPTGPGESINALVDFVNRKSRYGRNTQTNIIARFFRTCRNIAPFINLAWRNKYSRFDVLLGTTESWTKTAREREMVRFLMVHKVIGLDRLQLLVEWPAWRDRMSDCCKPILGVGGIPWIRNKLSHFSIILEQQVGVFVNKLDKPA